jgi:hypothetical protein
MLVKGNGSREEWCRGSRVRVGMRFGPVPFAEGGWGLRDLAKVVADARALQFYVMQVGGPAYESEYERWLCRVERSYQRALRPYRTKSSRAGCAVR